MQNPVYKSITLFFVIITISLGVKAQSNTLYYMDEIHQSNTMNPAYQSSYNGTFYLPGLSGISIEASNTGFDYNDIIHKGEGIYIDSLVIDLNNLKQKIRNSNYLMSNIQIPIFGMGFWIKNSYFTFDISNKTNIRISYPGDLVKLTEGNANYIGENNPIEINGVGPNILNYNEIAFGLSKQITHRLSIGGKFKVLSGTVNATSSLSKIKLFTAEDTYSMRLETDLKANITGPFTYQYNDNGQISGIEIDSVLKVNQVLSAQNLGMAIDLGAIYQFNDHLRFYTSITDLGFIRWKGNSKTISQKGSFEFSGLTLDSVWSNSDYNEFEHIADSLKEYFSFDESDSKYNTYLNTNIFLGATYDIGNFMNFGFLSKTYFFDKKAHESLTLSANFKPVKWFCGTISYSYINHDYRNIGLGFGIKLGPAQLFLISDNMFAAFEPKNTKYFRLQAGINFSMGREKRDNFSMLKDKKPAKDDDFM